MNTIGTYLKKKREMKGLTQRQVATQLGYGTAQFISNIERGASPLPVKSVNMFIHLYELPKDEVIEVLLEEKRQQLRRVVGAEAMA